MEEMQSQAYLSYFTNTSEQSHFTNGKQLMILVVLVAEPEFRIPSSEFHV